MELDTLSIVGTTNLFFLAGLVGLSGSSTVVPSLGFMPVASLYVRDALVGLLDDCVAADVNLPMKSRSDGGRSVVEL